MLQMLQTTLNLNVYGFHFIYTHPQAIWWFDLIAHTAVHFISHHDSINCNQIEKR